VLDVWQLRFISLQTPFHRAQPLPIGLRRDATVARESVERCEPPLGTAHALNALHDEARPAQLMRVAADLLRRLDVAAPRYTSYPTVPAWSDAFGPDDYARALVEAAASDEPLSLYVHIPFCKELCDYCGCNVVITRDQGRVERYLAALGHELGLAAALLGRRRTLSRVHFGGGTPTFLDEGQLTRLWRQITERFAIGDGAEVAIEVDPVVTTRAQLRLLGSFGFNRISMGVQDFDADVQRAVHRIQSVAETEAAIADARGAGFASVNLDLIYGLPHQTTASFARTMDQVAALEPDRVAVFSFAYVPSARPNQRRLPLAAIPTGDNKLALLEIARDRLAATGMVAVGIDHFARPGDELARAQAERRLWRDFQGYTTRHAAITVAVGASGISDFGGAYAQNDHALGQYEAAISAGRLATVKGIVLSADDRRRRDVIVQLMCNGWVDLGPDGEQYFARELDTLATLERDGLVSARGREVALTELGQMFARNVAMVFDAHLGPAGSRPTFSAAV
jgi:oxygen-independent coproporphyrinogen-3 oxidase